VTRLRDIADKIEALKDLNKAALENEARSAMARLAKFEPAKARGIATSYAKEPG
jgi:hypothetical protein